LLIVIAGSGGVKNVRYFTLSVVSGLIPVVAHMMATRGLHGR